MTGLRRRTAAALSGVVSGLLVLSGCSIYDAPLPGGPDVGDDPMTVTVMFRDVLDLVPQSTVKVNDVTVGKVSKVGLKGYVAEVTLTLPKDVRLPDNATAQIRQTSLLGEKFVSLAPPQEPSEDRLSDGDVIGLDRTGRNPEIEEVFGALALLLNGGGVGQLQTIAAELNNTFEGRESDVKSVLDQIRIFTTQLDQNKGTIVAALENTNRLAAQLERQRGTINAALDDIPDALASINRQRDDLVALLESLERLSGVGVRVIRASKESTINTLRDLGPVLESFAAAGQNLPKAFQVFLTYPFVDEAVGRDPQVARNLHMGDYTNLSVNLDLDLATLNLPGPTVTLPPEVCAAVTRAQAEARRLAGTLPAGDVRDRVLAALLAEIGTDCAYSLNDVREYFAGLVAGLGATLRNAVCPAAGQVVCGLLTNPTAIPTIPLNPLGGTGGSGGLLGGLTGGLNPRADLGEDYQRPVAQPIDPFGLAARGIDPGIGTMLLQGVAEVR